MQLRSLRLAGSLIVLLLCAGCVAGWKPGGGDFKAKAGYTVHPPFGWAYQTTPAGDISMTRDGFILNSLSVVRLPLKTPLPNSKRTLTAGMSSFDLAQAWLDELRADRARLDLDILSNVPDQIDGRDVCRLVLSWRTADGLRMSESRWSFILGSDVYLITYTAPTRHYYQENVGTGEIMVHSMKLPAAPAAPAKSRG